MKASQSLFSMRELIFLAAIMFLLSGCHAVAGALSGAAIGGGVTGRWQGAAIGGGAGLLAGALLETFDRHPASAQPHHQARVFRSDCERFRADYERMACEEGRAEAERRNVDDRRWRARNYGYNLQRDRYR